jgi:hypothetical protein
MLKLGASDRFWYPVRVEILDDDGVRRPHEFRALFRRYGRSDFERLMEKVRASEITDDALARDVLLGWHGVQDESGADITFSQEARERLLDLWPVLPAIIQAFIEAHSPEGRRKN